MILLSISISIFILGISFLINRYIQNVYYTYVVKVVSKTDDDEE